MGAEDAPVGVALVDDDVAQGAQEGGPSGVGGQDRAVEHVGVGERVIGVLTHPFAFFHRRVPVVDGGPDALAQGGGQGTYGAVLVGGEGLGGGEVEGGGAASVGGFGAVQEGAEDGGEVGEGLAGGGAGGHDDGFAAQGVLGGAGLVGPGPLDAGGPDGVDHFRPDLLGPGGMTSGTRGQVLRMSDACSPALPRGESVEDRPGRGVHARLRRELIVGHRHRVCHWLDGQWRQGVVRACR